MDAQELQSDKYRFLTHLTVSLGFIIMGTAISVVSFVFNQWNYWVAFVDIAIVSGNSWHLSKIKATPRGIQVSSTGTTGTQTQTQTNQSNQTQ